MWLKTLGRRRIDDRECRSTKPPSRPMILRGMFLFLCQVVEGHSPRRTRRWEISVGYSCIRWHSCHRGFIVLSRHETNSALAGSLLVVIFRATHTTCRCESLYPKPVSPETMHHDPFSLRLLVGHVNLASWCVRLGTLWSEPLVIS